MSRFRTRRTTPPFALRLLVVTTALVLAVGATVTFAGGHAGARPTTAGATAPDLPFGGDDPASVVDDTSVDLPPTDEPTTPTPSTPSTARASATAVRAAAPSRAAATSAAPTNAPTSAPSSTQPTTQPTAPTTSPTTTPPRCYGLACLFPH